MAHSGGKDTRQQQPELLQRHHYLHQQQHVDLPRVPRDSICTRDRDHTSTLATPYDPRPRSRHHGGGAVTFSNQLAEPIEVRFNKMHGWDCSCRTTSYCMVAAWACTRLDSLQLMQTITMQNIQILSLHVIPYRRPPSTGLKMKFLSSPLTFCQEWIDQKPEQ